MDKRVYMYVYTHIHTYIYIYVYLDHVIAATKLFIWEVGSPEILTSKGSWSHP